MWLSGFMWPCGFMRLKVGKSGENAEKWRKVAKSGEKVREKWLKVAKSG